MFSKEKYRAERSGALGMSDGAHLDSFMQLYLDRIARGKDGKELEGARLRPVQEDLRALREDILIVGWRETTTYRQMLRGCRRVRMWILRMVKSQIFFWVVLVAVFLDTAVLATEFYGQPEWLTTFRGSVVSQLFHSHSSTTREV